MNRLAELDDLIRAGWGNVPQPKIPANWRELNAEAYGSEGELEAERRKVWHPATAQYPDTQLALQVQYNENVRNHENWRPRRPGSGRGPHRRFFARPAIQQRAEAMRLRKGRLGRPSAPHGKPARRLPLIRAIEL